MRCRAVAPELGKSFTKHSLKSIHLALAKLQRLPSHRNFRILSLNYSLAVRLQDNSRPKSPTKVETKKKLQQITVSGWLIMLGGESGSKKKKTFRLKLHSV